MSSPKDADARRYYRAALRRLEEAELILEKVELPAAAIYLAGYGVECVLKALIIVVTPANARSGLLDAMKRDYGHSLHRLLTGLVERRVHLPSAVIRSFLFVSSWSPDLRYEPGPGDSVEAARFLKEAKAIVIWADRSI